MDQSTKESLNQAPTWNLETDGESTRQLVLKVGPCTPAELMEVLGALLEVEQILMDTPDTKEIPDFLKHKLPKNLLKNSKSKDDG